MTPKVLFCGVYLDGTGWSHSAEDYILALDNAGVDVVPRPIKLNALRFPLHKRIQELQEKSSSGCDVIIQHILPHMMEYNSAFKHNIALFELETHSIKHTMWPEYINNMDYAWVTNMHGMITCENSGVKIPTHFIPHAINTEKYNRDYLAINIPGVDGNFTFYTIADMNNRKNLTALIRAYHTEFDPSEPVSLVLKCSRYGMDNREVLTHLKAYCNEIKKGLGLYPSLDCYKPEVFIPNVVEDEQVYQLHNSCDCFVLPSCGEAFCIPAFDAMGFGKTPIVTKGSGFLDYMDDNCGWLVKKYAQQAFKGTDAFASIYTGKETWDVVDNMDLARCMREAYENPKLRQQKAKAGREKVKSFSYERTGSLLRKMLECYG